VIQFAGFAGGIVMVDDGGGSRRPSSDDFDLAGVASLDDLEERVLRLRVRAGNPTPGRVEKLSSPQFPLSKSTAARWITPWNDREPRGDVVLGFVLAYGIPVEELGAWREAYGRATEKTSASAEDPLAPKAPRRNAIGALVAGVTLVILVVIGWQASRSDSSPEPQASSVTVVPTGNAEPLDASRLTLMQRPHPVDLNLIMTWDIPQQPFDLDRFEPTSEQSRWDVTFECRPDRCPVENRFYTVLPTNRTQVAVLGASALDDPQPCLAAKYTTKWQKLVVGSLYCLRTSTRLGMLRVLELPATQTTAGVLVRLEMAGWAIDGR
jgi:hypothetical protein